MAESDWDLDKYYWPREAVLRWWDQGWDWDRLSPKQCPNGDYATYGDYYAPKFKFRDPRRGPNAPEITEADYWGERWLAEFPKGSGLRWTPYHLPLYCPNTLSLSEKYTDRPVNLPAPISDERTGRILNVEELIAADPPKKECWSDVDIQALALGLEARLRAAGGRYPKTPTGGSLVAYKAGNWTAPLVGVVLPINLRFSLSDISIDADFSDALIGKFCSFSKLDASVVDFQKVQFCRASFGPHTQFVRAVFRGAQFDKAWLNSPDFLDAVFQSVAEFGGATFFDYAQFAGVRFLGAANFGGAVFRATAGFANSQFGSKADFSGVEFCENAWFEGAQFCGELDYRRARFLKRAIFTAAVADAPGTVYSMAGPPTALGAAKAPLSPLRLSGGSASREDQEIERGLVCSANFSGVRFFGDADFSDRHFGGPTDFGAARFEGVAAFHGARLHENTIFPVGNGFSEPKRSLEVTTDWDRRCRNYEQSYRRLKLLMQQQCARTEEYAFYVLELKSRMKRSDLGYVEWLCAVLYRGLSDFGQSLLRPLLWLFVVVPTLFGCSFGGMSDRAGLGFAVTNVTTYLVRNLVPWVAVHDLAPSSREDAVGPYLTWVVDMLNAYGLSFYLLATFHIVLNVLLWFLFALALKRRFQIS